MKNYQPSSPSLTRHVRHRIQDGIFAKSARSRIESELTIGTLSLMRLTKFPIRLMVHAAWALLAVSTSHAADPKTLSVTVRLEKTTAIPNPTKSLDSHCLVMHKARAIKGLDGVPREIIVAFWGFRDRKVDVGSACKPGDYLEVQLVPWEQTDVKVREIRQSDEIVEPDLDLYWAKDSTVLTGEPREQAERFDKSLTAVTAARKDEARPAVPARPTPGPEGELVISGKLVEISPIPDPKKSLYKDCLVTAKVRVHEARPVAGAPATMVAIFWAFKDRSLQPASGLKAGDAVSFTAVPWDRAGVDTQQIRQSDEITAVDLPIYWADTVTRADAAKLLPPLPETAKVTPTAKPDSAPAAARKDDAVAAQRRADMEAERKWILAALERNGGTWEAWAQKLKPFIDDVNAKLRAAPVQTFTTGSPPDQKPAPLRLLVRDGYMLGQDAITHYPPVWEAIATSPASGIVPGLKVFRDELALRGIDLILLPVPTKESFCSRKFSDLAPADGIVSPQLLRHYLELMDNDIEVINLTRGMLESDAKSEFPCYYNWTMDHHWADGGRIVGARLVAERLNRYDFPKQFAEADIAVNTAPGKVGSHINYAWDKTFPTVMIGIKGQPADFNYWHAAPDGVKKSPIAVMGDSMVQEKCSTLGGTRFDHYLAWQTRVAPAVLTARIDQGNTTMMNGLVKAQGIGGDGVPAFLDGRRVLIFIFFQ
jgi:hypothetical protein